MPSLFLRFRARSLSSTRLPVKVSVSAANWIAPAIPECQSPSRIGNRFYQLRAAEAFSSRRAEDFVRREIARLNPFFLLRRVLSSFVVTTFC